MGKKFYQHPVYGRVYGTKVVTPRLPGAWPSLVEPRDPPPPLEGQEPGKPRYEITLVIPKDSEEGKQFEALVGDMVQQMVDQYNSSSAGKKAKIAIDDVFIDGDGGDFDLEKYPYYANSWLLICRNTNIPVFKNYKGEKFTDATVFLGGDIMKCEITPHLGPTGIAYKLEAVQLIKRGPVPMGGGSVNHGKMLEAEEDGEDLATVGSTVPAQDEEYGDSSDEIEDVPQGDEDYAGEDDEAEEETSQATQSTPVVKETPGKTAVRLTGKQLAENLKANVVSAQKGKVVNQPQKAAKAVPATQAPAAQPAKSGKAAAVDML